MCTSRFLAAAIGVVLVLALAACDDGPTGPGPAMPSQLVVVSGDEQAGVLGEPLGDPVVIRAVDAGGSPVAGVVIDFTILSGGGSVQPASATTGSDGRAQAVWTLGPSEGEQELGASAQGVSPVTVTASAIDLALCGTIGSDHTLRDVGRPYLLCSGGASVTNGATLQIQPGVTIVADSGAQLRIRTDGVLNAVGTQADRIRIVGASEQRGFWYGIWHESELPGNELAWVEIAHGGRGSYSNLYLSLSARVHIRDSVFRDGEDWGIHAAAAGVTLPDFARNEFRGNGVAAMRIYPQQFRYLDRASAFADNGVDVIDVRGATLDGEPHTVPNPGVPYRMHWLDISTDLTLEAGTDFVFLDDLSSGVRVHTDGSLRAPGTAGAPIRFIGERPEPGSWTGIWIESDADNLLDHVEVAHGGRGDGSNLMLGHSARVIVTHSTFRDGADYGIAVISSGVTLPDFASNELRGNQVAAMRLYANQIRFIDGGTTVSGNGEDVFEVRAGPALTGTGHVWRKTNAPFLLNAGVSPDVQTALVVEPGFRMLAAEDAGTIRIRSGASLTAIGTPADVIRFTAQNGQAGAWSGFWIESSGGNQLRYVEIAHGGRASGFHNVYLAGGASVTITNSIIRNSARWGIYVASQTSTLVQSDNSFSANASGDIRMP